MRAETVDAEPTTDVTHFDRAIATTLERHPALAAERARVEAKRYAVAEARSLRLPSLSGRVGHGIAGDEESAVSTLQLRQPLWTFGRIGREIDHARIDHEAELADLRTLRRDLAERTGIAYARVLGAARRLAASALDAERLSGLVEQVRRRAAAKLASPADVALAEARLVQIAATRERLDTELELARAELLALTQVPVAVEGAVPRLRTAGASLEALELDARRTAPSLRRDERLVALAVADAARARARARPTVYLEGRRSFGDDDLDGDESRISLVIEGGLDGLGVIGVQRARALDAGGRAAGAELEEARTELELRVRTLHASRASNRALVDGYSASIDRLDTTLASYRRQYDAGRKDWLELLNLYREVAELRLQLEQARTERTIDEVALAAITGRLDARAAAGEER